MFAYRFHSISASLLLSLASLLASAMPVSAQHHGAKSQTPNSQSYQQQLQQQLQKDQQFLQQQVHWFRQLEQQQQRMMQSWYQQQVQQQQIMQQWLNQRNSPTVPQHAPATQVRRPR